MKIYNLGSLNVDYVYQVDHFVGPGETLSSSSMQVFPGGKGLNQSIALANAGMRPIHGAVSGSSGDFLIQKMQRSGVVVDRIKAIEAPSGHAIIQVDTNGQNCILLYSGTNHMLDDEYIDGFLADAELGDILVLQNEVNHLCEIMLKAQEKGMQIAFNPSPYDASIKQLPLGSVTWWFCNEIEGAALFGGEKEDIISNFLVKYPNSNLILTLGESGSVFANTKEIVEQGIYTVNVVDTTAAGDTFSGYFIAGIASGETVKDSMDMAAKAAAITVSRHGASESIPMLEEVKAFGRKIKGDVHD